MDRLLQASCSYIAAAVKKALNHLISASCVVANMSMVDQVHFVTKCLDRYHNPLGL